MDKIIILGHGGTGRELGNLIQTDTHIKHIGYLDDSLSHKAVLGKLCQHKDFTEPGVLFCSGLANYKNMAFRRQYLSKIPSNNIYNFIYSNVVLYDTCKYDNGIVCFPNSVLSYNTQIGTHCLIYHGAIISHDVIIGDYSIISNGAVISGSVHIGENCYIGAGAVINENLTIGANSIIASNATVYVDVPEKSIYITKDKVLPNKYIK